MCDGVSQDSGYGHEKSHLMCHAPNPGPTLSADLNQVPGREIMIGTLYLIFFFFFFLQPNWYLWVWPTSYNNSKYYIHITESHLQIQNFTFTFTIQSTEPTCSEPLQVCWPSCMRMFADVFSCTYTD